MSEGATAKPPTAEDARLDQLEHGENPWRRWGPWVSERQWGTVREDYSPDGAAWDSFPHDHARSRTYRWGEDAIAGWCDARQTMVLGLALWNGQDPILKERLFGLTNSEGNHGEDIKELHYHCDALPSCAYARYLYKYPQRAFPYDLLVSTNRSRTRMEAEYELLDTGLFDDGRYFDIVVEYAKGKPDTVLMRIEAFNRGPAAADLWIVPQVWYRNTWSWSTGTERPRITASTIGAMTEHPLHGPLFIACDGKGDTLFCENETNAERHGGAPRDGRRFKDGIHEHIVLQRFDAATVGGEGSKCAFVRKISIPAGKSAVVRLRMGPPYQDLPGWDSGGQEGFEERFRDRRAECDEFWGRLQERVQDPELRAIQRAAWSGLIWTRQYYRYDVRRWLQGDPALPPPPPPRMTGRNAGWSHLDDDAVITMPDKWEYPWYAAWDLALQAEAISHFDVADAKRQLLRILHDRAMHPNGQLPAYEWAFGDANPPIHAWAALRIYRREFERTGVEDLDFLRSAFHRLLLNFTWWVNRRDADGRNIFQGGFLGLDNVGVFDRSAPLPDGGTLQQADGTSWMAMFALNMMRIATTLALHDRVYEDMATKFFEHFLQIALAATDTGGTGDGLWDESDGFYFDRLRLPDGSAHSLKIHSIVGLIPMLAVEVLEPETLQQLPEFKALLEDYFVRRPEMASLVSRWNEPGRGDRRLFSLLRGFRLKCLLRHALDERQFLSPYGIRSMSRSLEQDPFVLWWDGNSTAVRYEPGESRTGTFGGNSNWRGPVWMPLNYLLIQSLYRFHAYYGDDFTVEFPVGSGKQVTLRHVADELRARILRLFRRDGQGLKPCLGAGGLQQTDPHFRDLHLFHEYFDGNTGRGCGANHQTGWTALVASLISEGSS